MWQGAASTASRVDDEVLRYAQWISSQADLAGDLDQKLSALSRRTAAEFQRASRERVDLGHRIAALEDFCGSRLEAFVLQTTAKEVAYAQARLERHLNIEIGQVSEHLGQLSTQMQAKHSQCSQALEGLARHMDSGSEEMHQWRQDADARVQAAISELEAFKSFQEDLATWRADVDRSLVRDPAAAVVAMVSSRGQARKPSSDDEDFWETALLRERKMASERLASSCAELTGHLNDLREELLEQRSSLKKCVEQARVGKQEAQRGQELRDAWLEVQVADLGSALSAQLDERLHSLRLDGPASHAAVSRQASSEPVTLECVDDIRRGIQELREFVGAETDRAVELAQDEARIVHHEVMSLDMRVATLEASSGSTKSRPSGCAGSIGIDSGVGAGSGSSGLRSPAHLGSWHRSMGLAGA